jgi:hypothetical protein
MHHELLVFRSGFVGYPGHSCRWVLYPDLVTFVGIVELFEWMCFHL